MEKLKNNNLVIKPLIMLSTFPKDFSFPKWKFPKGIFLSGNFPNVEFSKRQFPKPVLVAVLGLRTVLAAASAP